ncbi:MAG: pilus assembly PilX N-terminal domain-containing protein, partial [Acidobacteriota bacterium]|nr:pilus assembly PilX N-terminal domain-containing protein [Acidobacteriota bacterium]
QEKGVILIFALLILAIMLFSGSYLISSNLTGFKMSSSQVNATRAYYLAEAGVEEAIFKLKNDSVWKSAFETQPTSEDPTCSSWSISDYERSSGLFEGGSYEITIENLGCAQAEITSVATITTGDKKVAQRIIKTEVFKAIVTDSSISEFNIFTSGSSENITINATDPLNIHNGSIFSNNKIKLQFGSEVNVDKKALANNKIDISSWPFTSYLNASAVCANNRCEGDCLEEGCPPQPIPMPPLDFNFYSESAKNNDCSLVRTDGETNCYFNSSEKFEKMLWDNYPEITLNGVIYVDGDINIRAGQDITINGTLVSGENKNINIGEEYAWFRPESPYARYGYCDVDVYSPGGNNPSGILAQKKINIGGWFGLGTKTLYVEGLIYSGYEMKFSSVSASIEIHGGIASSKFTLSSMWDGIDVYLDSNIITNTFGNAQYSPVISINHWEEEY